MAKKTADYTQLSKKTAELIGGVDNVTYFTHCWTRLRFNVKDKEKVDLEAFKKMEGVMGAQWSGDQLQIVIGNSVDAAYDMICKETGLSPVKSEADDTTDNSGGKKKFNPFAIIDVVSGSISPVISLLIGTGLVKIVMLLGTFTGLISADSSTYAVLSFVSDSAFYFLPIFVGFAAATRFGMNSYMGGLLGAMLVHPNFVALVGEGGPLSVFGIPVYSATYANSIFPVILVVWAASYVENSLRSMHLRCFGVLLYLLGQS